MSIPSDAYNLFTNVQTQIEGLGLTFAPPPPASPFLVSVQIKKHGFWADRVALPVLPIILIITEDKPESTEPFGSENYVLAKYLTTIVSVAAGNKDNTANLDVWWNWREQQRRLFQWSLQPFIPDCFKAEFVGDAPLLREAFLKNYDVSGFGLRLWNVEPRTNPGG